MPDHVLDPLAIGEHVGSGQVILEVVEGFPLFNDGYPIFIPVLAFQIRFQVNRWAVLDAALFLQNLRNDFLECNEKRFSLTSFDFNLGDDVNHGQWALNDQVESELATSENRHRCD